MSEEQKTDRVVDFNGVEHHFPAEATDAQISAALKAIPASNAPMAPKARTWTDVGVDALPAVGGAIGGFAGLGGGPVGSVAGAAAGGLVGERLKQYANAARGTEPLPSQMDAVGRMAIQGAKEGATQTLGLGAGALLKDAAPLVMRNALGVGAKTAAGVDVAKTALATDSYTMGASLTKLDNFLAGQSGVADRAAAQATRDAVARAYTKVSSAGFLEGATAGAVAGYIAKGGPLGSTNAVPAIGAVLGAIAKDPRAQYAISQGLYHAAGFITGIAPQVIRGTMLSLAESSGPTSGTTRGPQTPTP